MFGESSLETKLESIRVTFVRSTTLLKKLSSSTTLPTMVNVSARKPTTRFWLSRKSTRKIKKLSKLEFLICKVNCKKGMITNLTRLEQKVSVKRPKFQTKLSFQIQQHC